MIIKRYTFLIFCLLLVSSCTFHRPGLRSVDLIECDLEYEHLALHVVKFKGENPSMISKWYTLSPNQWKVIQQYNGQVSASDLQVGDTVRIPYELIKQFQPMPKHFVDRELKSYSKKPRKLRVNQGESSSDIDDEEMEEELLKELIPDNS